ncbi:MAG: class I SAM-dependent methyltransferase [Myxococcota bacterium]|nr:class I SAM-dependent methyltransferase [Myxococcota bacterium]
MGSRWPEIWSQRPGEAGVLPVVADRHALLTHLLQADGYGSGFNALGAEDWLTAVDELARLVGMNPGEQVLEIGCGAGAFLLPLAERGLAVAGLDYSPAQIAAARRALPAGDFWVGEARDLDPRRRFDHVVSFSVFFYFPDLAYARRVIERACAIARRTVLIGDVADAARQEEAIAFRRGRLGEAEYATRYARLEHLYYDREWFSQVAAELGWGCEIHDQQLPGHEMGRFRFNVILRRPTS